MNDMMDFKPLKKRYSLMHSLIDEIGEFKPCDADNNKFHAECGNYVVHFFEASAGLSRMAHFCVVRKDAQPITDNYTSVSRSGHTCAEYGANVQCLWCRDQEAVVQTICNGPVIDKHKAKSSFVGKVKITFRGCGHVTSHGTACRKSYNHFGRHSGPVRRGVASTTA